MLLLVFDILLFIGYNKTYEILLCVFILRQMLFRTINETRRSSSYLLKTPWTQNQAKLQTGRLKDYKPSSKRPCSKPSCKKNKENKNTYFSNKVDIN